MTFRSGTKYINQLLTDQHIAVDEIRSSTDSTTIILADKSEQKLAHNILNNNLADNYLIGSSVNNDAPAWLKKLGNKPIKLGLDLSRGVLFVLDVDTERALSDKLKDIILDIKIIAMKNHLRGIKVTQPDNFTIKVNNSPAALQSNEILLTKITEIYPELTQQKKGKHQFSLTYSPQEQVKFRQETMKHTLKTMRGRIEELGITEAVTQKQGKNRIRIELPGVHNQEEAKRIIGATASLEFYQMAANSKASGIKRIRNDDGQLLVLNSKIIFSGSNIKNARAGQDQMSFPLVSLSLDAIGGKKMSDFSKRNIGKTMVTIFSEFYRDANNKVVKKSKVISEATIQAHLGANSVLPI